MGVRNKNNYRLMAHDYIADSIMEDKRKTIHINKITVPNVIPRGKDKILERYQEKQDKLGQIKGAQKILDYREYLREHGEEYYLQPKDFRKFINVFYNKLMSESPTAAEREKIEKTDDNDEFYETYFPKISLGIAEDNNEYFLDLKKKDYETTYIYELGLYRNTPGDTPEKITVASITNSGARNIRIQDDEEKLLFRGFLRLLEVAEGEIPSAYYQTMRRRSE